MSGKLRICAYSNCEKSVNSMYDEEHCLFHAPKEKKGIAVDVFNKLIFAQIKRRDYNFRGYVFPGEIIFQKEDEVTFKGNAKFRDAHFNGNVKFVGIQFSGYADFRDAHFLGYADFRSARFSRLAVFNKARFFRIVAFNKACFLGDADFLFAQFSSRALFHSADFFEGANFGSAQFYNNAEFIDAHFSKKTLFNKTKFLEKAQFKNLHFEDTAEFHQTHFSGDALFTAINFSKDAFFDSAQFSGETTFEELIISSSIFFRRLNITASSIFKMISPRFSGSHPHNRVIEFSHVIFNPDKTFFENFSVNSPEDSFENKMTVLFRYCMLKDVFFSHNDLGIFSFFNSTFDQARFISNTWQKEKSRWSPFYKRQNILLDEILFSRLKEMRNMSRQKFEKEYKLERLESYGTISALYRRMKTAHDNTKDYFEAGWFYYNELETKRLMLKDEIKKESFFRSVSARLQKGFYDLFKLFSGYGEKPLRSLVWFWLFALVVFPGIHGLNGLTIKMANKTALNINFDFTRFGRIFEPIFWQDYLYAVAYSLNHVIPFNFLSFDNFIFVPNSPQDIIWSFLNSVVMLMLAGLIGLGLGRKLKRF